MRRKNLVLGVVAWVLGSCWLIVPQPDACEEANFKKTCQGEQLSVCEQNFVVNLDCEGQCVVGSGTIPDHCLDCGDANFDLPEGCDDGNNTSGDGCSDICEIEICGNNRVDAGEECDDGNTAPLDGCDAACQDEVCGDGIDNNNNAEQCDDGNQSNTDACTNACQTALCGDTFIQAGVEGCDDGNQVNNDGCTNTCDLPNCGDNIVQVGEQCDLGNGNSDTGSCTTLCQNAECGDNFIQAGVETCDDGNITPLDGCNTTCQDEFCGDNITNDGGNEDCDDGNQSSGDGCDNCVLEFCGDGIENNNNTEQCDDGNNINADGCEANCLNPACGNAINDPGEFCFNLANSIAVNNNSKPTGIVATDVDKDNDIDIVISNELTNDIVFFLNPGESEAGNFSSFIVKALNLQTNVRPVSIATGDIDSDTDNDLLIVHAQTNDIAFVINTATGVGNFSENNFVVRKRSGIGNKSIDLIHLDGDNDLDIVTTIFDSNQIGIHINQNGDFLDTDPVPFLLPLSDFNTGGITPRAVASGNFDPIANTDLVVVNETSNEISIFKNFNNNNFSSISELPTGGIQPTDIITVDFNEDNKLDIAVPHIGTDEVRVFLGLGDSEGSFIFQGTVGLTQNQNSDPVSIQSGDFNSDGFLDIAVANSGSNNITILTNDGAGNFAFRENLATGLTPVSLAVADFNKDEIPDLATANSEDSVSIILSNP